MKRFVLFFVFMTFLGFARSQSPLDLNYVGTWTDDDVNTLCSKLKNEAIPNFQIDILKKSLIGKAEGFTSPQTISILSCFETSTYKARAVDVIDDHVLGLKCKEVVDVINMLVFSSHKLEVLEALKNTITDTENKALILTAFKSSVDKAKAQAILDKVSQPRSFIYGTVRSKKVVFVVDISGSMDASFTASNGKNYSRIQFVKLELAKALLSLDQSCKFNIIFFNHEVKFYNSGMIQATSDNVQKAINYIAGINAGGGTSIYDALETAFSYGDVNTIYFLTDGTPTSGKKTSPDDIVNDVQSWSSAKNINIFSTAFLMGSDAGDNKQASRDLMRRLAVASKGVYRSIE